MSEEKKADPFCSAKDKLRDALTSGAEQTAFARDEIEALLYARPPEKPSRNVSSCFGSDYLRFLRPAVEEGCQGMFRRFSGVHVEKHKDKGVVLMATNGRVILMAHDTEGGCSESGMRFSVPRGVFDACTPPKPHTLWWQGMAEEIEDCIPGYAIPDSVFAYGGGIAVMPKDQPEGTDPEDGGALFSAMTERYYAWHDERYCIDDVVNWRPWVADFMGDASDIPMTLRSEIIPAVSDAMEVFPETVWAARRSTKNTITMTPQNRDDLCIIFTAAPVIGEITIIPSWLREIAP